MQSHSTGKMWLGDHERPGLKFGAFDAIAHALDHWATYTMTALWSWSPNSQE